MSTGGLSIMPHQLPDSIFVLGKLSRNLFPVMHTLSKFTGAGDVFYAVGLLVGLILWGFSIMMIATSGGLPFNMGWWGFIFPVGVFTLLTISIGEELESQFLKVLSCLQVREKKSFTGKMFFAPCLGTDLFMKRSFARRQKSPV
ncbi:hypothetical protein IFR04_006550 [Cadophora malorum]|uniref:Uncharacterized protein n=1 Tax=Cadophora malorum TaxID=108018 RepID=A0A8H7WBC2_9HELO|nr:hypothetical protein IFR04_006550 [Cadophora malorum]